MTENKTNFNEETIKRLEFIKWIEAQSGRPDRHGRRISLPEFIGKGLEEPTKDTDAKPFMPENMTGV